MQRIVGRCLVGYDIRNNAALQHQRKDLCSIADETDRDWFTTLLMIADHFQCCVEIVHLAIAVPVANTLVDAFFIDLDTQCCCARNSCGKGLSTTHPAQTGGQQEASVQRAAKVLTSTLGKRFVRALHDTLCADVDPRSSGHLTVHHQTQRVETTELIPRCPLRYEVRIRNDHAWRACMRLHNAHRLTTLHQQRFVHIHRAQTAQDRIEGFPIARCLTKTPVHNQIFRLLGICRVEVVLNHAIRCLELPVLTVER